MPDPTTKERDSRRRSPLYSTDTEDDRRRRRGKRERDRSRNDERRRPRDAYHNGGRVDRMRRRSGSPGYNHSRRRRDEDSEERPSKRRRSSSHSAPQYRDKPSRSHSPIIAKRSRNPLPSQEKAYNGEDGSLQEGSEVEKQKPNFSNTGKLAAETNTVAGTDIVLKYNEPPEARKPPSKDAWRLYLFKGPDLLETVELGGRSCWLVGRERMVVDFPLDHPSCSKQHAVVQFRHVIKTNEFGDRDGRVRPYIIDLESANGTMVNGNKIPASRYIELRDKDMIQFGLSTREYVLMLPPAG
ncbi:MAG: hypothetical protein M1830_004098 [Pleopsidium flavum]|nr:MAG: hypothetical protein M1830_004098 [Pleopsidium flavum]